jgi:N-glycosylase/DNA lyase
MSVATCAEQFAETAKPIAEMLKTEMQKAKAEKLKSDVSVSAFQNFSVSKESFSFAVRNYDLAATLACGQAFRWTQRHSGWSGVVNGHWIELQQRDETISVRTAAPISDWRWLEDYLQLRVDLTAVLATFPDDDPMRRAIAACRGLRLLRQNPWECLASFILSSTKQIVQIRQIIATLCQRHGEPVAVPAGEADAFAFPTPERIAALSEAELRDCKMGFRAPNLLNAARKIAAGEFDLGALRDRELSAARESLLTLPGVGPKIADCVLLFSLGFPTAFPVDVWVVKALQCSYFRNRRVNLATLREFSSTRFGPNGGYAQQYLFHAIRLEDRKNLSPAARQPVASVNGLPG